MSLVIVKDSRLARWGKHGDDLLSTFGHVFTDLCNFRPELVHLNSVNWRYLRKGC